MNVKNFLPRQSHVARAIPFLILPLAGGCGRKNATPSAAKDSQSQGVRTAPCEIPRFEEAFPKEEVALIHGTISKDFESLVKDGIMQDGKSDNFGDFGFGHYTHYGDDPKRSMQLAKEWAQFRAKDQSDSHPVVLEIKLPRRYFSRIYGGKSLLFNDMAGPECLSRDRQSAWLDFMRKFGRMEKPKAIELKGKRYWRYDRKPDFVPVPYDIAIGPMYKTIQKDDDPTDADFVPMDHEGHYPMQYVFYGCGLRLLNSSLAKWTLHSQKKSENESEPFVEVDINDERKSVVPADDTDLAKCVDQ